MAVTVPSTAKGLECTFQTLNPTDPQIYRGVIGAVDVDYDTASFFQMIVPYNNAVRQADNTVSADPTQLNYLILKQENSDDSSTPAKVAIAWQWIKAGMFTVINSSTPINITVQNAPANAAQPILDLLWQAGYNAYLQT